MCSTNYPFLFLLNGVYQNISMKFCGAYDFPSSLLQFFFSYYLQNSSNIRFQDCTSSQQLFIIVFRALQDSDSKLSSLLNPAPQDGGILNNLCRILGLFFLCFRMPTPHLFSPVFVQMSLPLLELVISFQSSHIILQHKLQHKCPKTILSNHCILPHPHLEQELYLIHFCVYKCSIALQRH